MFSLLAFSDDNACRNENYEIPVIGEWASTQAAEGGIGDLGWTVDDRNWVVQLLTVIR